MKSFSYQADVGHISFSFDYNYDSITIDADKEKLETILFNILSNAYKYTPVNGTIKVWASEGDHKTNPPAVNQLCFGHLSCDKFIEIAIENSGPGIDQEDLIKIFNRFEQGKKNDDSSVITSYSIHYTKLYDPKST